jgi:hypothetical protein
VPLPIPDSEKQSEPTKITGKIVNIETLFPIWDDNEIWSEPIPQDKLPQINYPSTLGVVAKKSIVEYFQLLPDEPVDPKAKKKEKPKTGKGQPAPEPELTEKLTTEDGKQLPVIVRGEDNEEFPELKPFSSYRKSAEEDENVVEDCFDPVIVDAFRMIAEFYPHLSSDAAHSSKHFLWRNIYPKLPSNKPVYNPSGKYCVRLFLAGQWRKVYVDDSLPVNSNGKIAVASSADNYELWPVVLSKAIYTVYTACGYSFADFPSSSSSSTGITKLYPAQQTCQFLSFALHMLTAWTPHHSADTSTLFNNEQSKSLKLLHNMLAAGVPVIPGGKIVHPEDAQSFYFKGQEPIDVIPTDITATVTGENAVDVEQSNNLVLKTKRQFREEYLQRRQQREKIISDVNKREEKINYICRQLTTAKQEVYCIILFNHFTSRYEVYPILALSFVEDTFPDASRLLETQVLLHWRRNELIDIVPASDDAILHGKGKVPVKEFLEPYPKASPIEHRWKSLGELAEDGAYITALFTLYNSSYVAHWSRHWQPLAPVTPVAEDPKDKKGKRAVSRGKDAPPPTSNVDELYAYPGHPPVTLLSLNISELYNQQQQSTAELEVMEAMEEQMKALQVGSTSTESSTEDGENNIKFFNIDNKQAHVEEEGLRITFTIHADMITDIKRESTSSSNSGTDSTTTASSTIEEEEERAPVKRGLGPRQMSWDSSSLAQAQVLPSDVVLLIQELRTDHEPPLVFLAQLKNTSLLPMMSKSFLIPKHRLPKNDTNNGQMLFWLRLFTKSSVCISLHTSVSASIGLAEDIWTNSSASTSGRYAYVDEGDAQVTVEGTEQLLFRLPLTTSNSSHSNNTSEKALVYLHIGDSVFEEQTQMMMVSIQDGQSVKTNELSDLQGQLIDVSSSNVTSQMLLAYCKPHNEGKQIAKFHWKLVVLSYLELQRSPRPIHEQPISQRYTGRYIANNRFRLFRDVYTIERPSFPISMKFSLSQLLPAPENIILDHIPFSIRMLRKSDGYEVAQYHGFNVIYSYFQDISKFISEADRPPTATAAPSKDKGKDKGKAPAVPIIETMDIIIECTLDVEHIEHFPEAWYSRFPHVFDDLFEKKTDDGNSESIQQNNEVLNQQNELLLVKPPKQPLLEWAVDVLSGKVTTVSHDISTLVKFAGVKNSWEAKTTGQTERATAAINYVKEKIQLKNSISAANIDDLSSLDSASTQIDFTATMATNVTTALTADMEEIQQRFTRLHKLPNVSWYIYIYLI